MKNKIKKYTYYTDDWDDYLKDLKRDVQKSSFLPKYHLYPKTGLMNDPNGLSYFNGNYHIFYQWFPFDSFHGMKHWGHAESKDLIHFDDKGFALIPDQEYEKNGAYSGNAFQHDNQLYLYYTANYKTENGKIAKQALAIMDADGTITKYPNNPIIDGVPKGFSHELRDPFVFQRNGCFYMLLGGGRFLEKERTGFGDIGELLLYSSDNLIDWTYKGTIDLPIATGYMLECPSLVTIDGKDILFLSPMGYEKEQLRFQNRFATTYLVGELDVETLEFTMDFCDEIDHGFDYYAPQSFYGKDNVPLTMGWFGCGEQEYPHTEGWKHGLTTAQELRLENNRLYRYPEQALLNQFMSKQTSITEKITWQQPYYHLSFSINKDQDFVTSFGHKQDQWQIILNAEKQLLSIDRSGLASEIDTSFGTIRSISTKELDDTITFDLFADNSFNELYINKGEKVFTFRTFLKNSSNTILFSKPVDATLAYFEFN